MEKLVMNLINSRLTKLLTTTIVYAYVVVVGLKRDLFIEILLSFSSKKLCLPLSRLLRSTRILKGLLWPILTQNCSSE